MFCKDSPANSVTIVILLPYFATIQPLSTEKLFFICLFVMLAVTSLYSLNRLTAIVYHFPIIEPNYVIALLHIIGLSCFGCSVYWFKIIWMTYYLILDDVLFYIIILNYEF